LSAEIGTRLTNDLSGNGVSGIVRFEAVKGMMKNGRTSGEILFDMDLFVNPSNGHSKGNFISSSGMIVEERRSSYEAETEGSCKQLPSRSVVRQAVIERQ